ncbi:hypothetical protein ULMS_23210 [Patiriisocius marinistellae]|uniref:UDP-glycosyltransferase n=1 Tax=Patiriisocius marinistellae TaxID=2494560 RepID=A0A5J4FXP8_9FLAO|nr:UDP-glycosyltransferase [Patiriisocius marinistellae]GEQ86813.1 hypothetical protein ULMS_23210 [Patiriisocius marinistellae]
MQITNVLVATNHLNALGGSETFVYTLIEALIKRSNIHVEYFTLHKGIVSKNIEEVLGVSYMTKPKYDVIFANHNTTIPYLHKKGFTIQICHGIFPVLEQPSPLANAHISISQEVQSHLAKKGFNSLIVLNGININRFYPAKPINKTLTNVLSLCKTKEANNVIKEACKISGVHFVEANMHKKKTWNVEEVINEADIVVGLGRSAYEAMSCGRPVIVFDDRTYFESMGDGYIRNILGLSIQNNCSGRYSKTTYTPALLASEMLKYKQEDGVYFKNFALKELNIDIMVDRYIEYWKSIERAMVERKKNYWIILLKKHTTPKLRANIKRLFEKN